MKKIIILIFILSVLISCNKQKEGQYCEIIWAECENNLICVDKNWLETKSEWTCQKIN